ncbi:MAG: 50S ribosomal protein L19, partial [Janthinobacterium lividum]
MNIIDQYEAKQIADYTLTKKIPEFKAGDSVKVSVKVTEGASERLQSYEGVVIARRNRGLTSSFVVRKISHGEGVERRFMIYSPIVQNIEVTKYGIVRRSKLFYLRQRSGKSAR